MKILISLTYYLPHISGLTTYVDRLSQGLTQKGHEVTILTSQHKSSLKRKDKVNGVDVIRVPYLFKFSKGLIMPKFFLTSFDLVRKHDVINCHLPQFESIFLVFWAIIFRKKIVFTHHVELPQTKEITRWISNQVIFLVQLITTPFVNTVIAYTEDYAKHGSKYLKIFKHKVKSTYPPVKLSPKDKEFISQFSNQAAIKKDQFVIGFIGRIAKEKGIDVLLQTIPHLKQRLNNFKIILIGPTKVIGDKTYSKMQKQLNKYEQAGILTVYGSVDPNYITNVYKKLDLLLLPSVNESFGIVQIEAMLNKVPVIAPNIPGARVPVKETKMGEVFTPNDPRDLTNKIIKISKDLPKYKQYYPQAQKLFDYKKTVNFYEEIFS